VTGCIPAESHEGLWIQRGIEHFGHEVGNLETWIKWKRKRDKRVRSAFALNFGRRLDGCSNWWKTEIVKWWAFPRPSRG
jgi:hypothetical protein